MSRKIIAWIGGLSLVVLGLFAVGGIVAMRLLAAVPEGRTVTGAPVLERLHQVAAGQNAAAAPAAKGADGVENADEDKASGDQARKDCMELLADDGHMIALHKTLKLGPGGHPLTFTWAAGEGLSGAVEAGLEPAIDPMATVAAELGLTSEALNKALEEGKALKDLAAAKGKTLEQLETAAQEAARKDLRARLQVKVDSGELTAAEADKQAADIHLKLLDGDGPHHGLKVGIEMHGMGRMVHRFIGKALHGQDGPEGDEDVVMGMATVAGAPGAEPFTFKLPEPMSQADQDAVKAVLEQAVKAGGLSRAQADAAIARLAGPPLPLMLEAVPAMPAIPAAPAAPVAPAAAPSGR